MYTVPDYVICGSVSCSYDIFLLRYYFYTDIGTKPSNPRPLVPVLQGYPLILNCTLPISVPPVTVEWKRGSTNVVMLADSNRFSIYSSETTSSLIVSYIDAADTNTYRCMMSNHLLDVNYTQPVADVTLGSSCV